MQLYKKPAINVKINHCIYATKTALMKVGAIRALELAQQVHGIMRLAGVTQGRGNILHVIQCSMRLWAAYGSIRSR
jgi:hypothetical protein